MNYDGNLAVIMVWSWLCFLTWYHHIFPIRIADIFRFFPKKNFTLWNTKEHNFHLFRNNFVKAGNGINTIFGRKVMFNSKLIVYNLLKNKNGRILIRLHKFGPHSSTNSQSERIDSHANWLNSHVTKSTWSLMNLVFNFCFWHLTIPSNFKNQKNIIAFCRSIIAKPAD